MLTLTEIEKPKIDIELYGTDTYINPIDKVKVMDEDSFEQFTLEWLYGCKKSSYAFIQRIGGAGDKGRDIIAHYSDGSLDYYQCKHYKNSLAPTDYYLELAKLCYYTFIKQIPIPKNYYIIASNDIGSSLQDLIVNPDSLRKNLKSNWDRYCKSKITKTNELALVDDLLNYVDSFDFSIIDTYPIAKIIDEYLDTVYGKIRFGGRNLELPALLTPSDTLHTDELNYISELLKAYSDELNIEINTIEALEAYRDYFEHLNRQRKDYYSAETIRRFVRDTLTDSQQFEILKTEIYDGVIDTHEQSYDNGYKRLVAVLIQASKTTTSKSLLDSKLHCIGNSERKGVCHMLTNDKKISWVIKND
jgi:hypothetical protein